MLRTVCSPGTGLADTMSSPCRRCLRFTFRKSDVNRNGSRPDPQHGQWRRRRKVCSRVLGELGCTLRLNNTSICISTMFICCVCRVAYIAPHGPPELGPTFLPFCLACGSPPRPERFAGCMQLVSGGSPYLPDIILDDTRPFAAAGDVDVVEQGWVSLPSALSSNRPVWSGLCVAEAIRRRRTRPSMASSCYPMWLTAISEWLM